MSRGKRIYALDTNVLLHDPASLFRFELVSDTDEALCRAFGVIKLKNMYGRQVLGIERSTFLIAPDGRIAQAWRGVKVPGHAQAVLDAIPAK